MENKYNFEEVVKMAEGLGYKGSPYKNLIQEFIDEKDEGFKYITAIEIMQIGTLLNTL